MDIINAIDIMAQHNLIRPVKVIGDYYRVYCPIHNHGNEKKASCGVLIHDQYKNGQLYPEGWVHCFSCGHADSLVNTVDKILKDRDADISGTEWMKQNIPDFEEDSDFDYLVPPEIMEHMINKQSMDQLNALLNKPEQTYISEEELASYRFTVPYMYERKLTDKIIEDYDIGYDANFHLGGRKNAIPCITFPVRDRTKQTLFICRRSIEGKLFHYPQDVTKPVYGIEMIEPGTHSVIICESCINALNCVAYGYPAVATLGTGNAYQIQQLKELGVHEYILCFDGDDAGERATKKFKRALKSTAFIWTMHMPEGEDVNSISREKFEQLYAERD